ncbi:MAG: hypothetical protein Q9222_004258 [Ikaeria aurantiellina]
MAKPLETNSIVVWQGQPTELQPASKGVAAITKPDFFETLPTEILQEISVYLNDRDLVSFALVQRCTSDAVLPANAGHWRQRFKALFDLPPGKYPTAIKSDYQRRKRYLSPHILFKSGTTPKEKLCLSIVKQLIAEYFSNTRAGPSLNLKQLWRFMERSNLLHDAFRWRRPAKSIHEDGSVGCDRLLLVVRVLFFPLTLHLSTTKEVAGAFPFSLRRTAYQICESEKVALSQSLCHLVNHDGDINFDLVAHLTNFWKFHIATNEGGRLYDVFSDLDIQTRPMLWNGKIKHGKANLGRKWKGAYFYPYYTSFFSHITHTEGSYSLGDSLLNLELNLASQLNIPWPGIFDDQTRGHPHNLQNLGLRMANLEKFYTAERLMGKMSHSNPSGTPTWQSSGIKANGNSRLSRALPRRHQDTTKANLDPERLYSDSTNSTDSTVGYNERDLQYKIVFGTGEHTGRDEDVEYAGIVHALPPQDGIPGWQRFSMVAFDTPLSGSATKGYLDANEDDLRNCFISSYEGVVLPGSTMIIGQYHEVEGEITDHGPFIYWNVPDDDVGDVEDR